MILAIMIRLYWWIRKILWERRHSYVSVKTVKKYSYERLR